MSVQTNQTLSANITFHGERLRAIRKKRGISADRLARATGLTARHIFRLERNERPKIWGITAAQMAIALGISIDYLFGLTDDPTPTWSYSPASAGA